MSYVRLPSGFLFPDHNYNGYDLDGGFGSSTMDAATEKVALIGYCHLEGHTGSKTISAAGGGSIGFRLGGVTFVNGSTTLDVGIQDVATGSGPLVQPDGSFDVSVTLTGGGGGLSANAWNTIAMTGGTGTKTISHGDLIAIVLDMTARGGADTVSYVMMGSNDNFLYPVATLFTASWAVARYASTLITFDDGTHGVLRNGYAFSAPADEAFQDSTNPDERGMKWTQPFDCKIDGLFAAVGNNNDAAADFTLKLYSDPAGTPALVTSLAVLAEQLGTASTVTPINFSITETELTKGTVYGLTVLATGTANTDLRAFTMGSSAWTKFSPAGTSLAKISRDGSSGAFTVEDPALTMYPLAVRVSQIGDTGASVAPQHGNMTGGMQ